MSFLHNIKKTCASTTNLIKNILNIKDKHITFPVYAYAFSNEKVHGVLSKVFSGLLSYPENPHCCSFCGKSGTVIKHTLKASLIQMIPYQNVPTYLRLYKQRYRCKAYEQTFSSTTNIVDERCYLSNALKFAILHEKQLDEFFHILHTLPEDLDIAFKKSLKYLIKHTHAIKNALQSPYSNGKLERKNNLIKVFQRVAFGFRNFSNMRRRIFLYEENWHTKQPTKRNFGEKSA